MNRQRVLEALDTLKAELAGADKVSPESREALERLTAQVRDAVAEGDAPGDGDEVSGLQEALLEFESEHPQLTGAINQVAAALANLGI